MAGGQGVQFVSLFKQAAGRRGRIWHQPIHVAPAGGERLALPDQRH
jgi:hypothetical protein